MWAPGILKSHALSGKVLSEAADEVEGWGIDKRHYNEASQILICENSTPPRRLARYSPITLLARHSDNQSHARVETVVGVEVFDKLCANYARKLPVTSGQARNRLPKAE